MSSGFGAIGNGELLAKVRADGTLTEAFYPSIGFFRHILQSQFGLHVRETDQTLWLGAAGFEAAQSYLEDTNVLQTTYAGQELSARLIDLVVPDQPGIVRLLEVENTGSRTLHVDLFHAEASSVADHRGQFGYNVAYYNRLSNHVVRYRGHPWDNAVEAQVVWLIAGDPVPDSYQCGVSYQDHGEGVDAFLDVKDGDLHKNRYAFADPNGTTTALMWCRELEPGESVSVAVHLVAGMSLFEAEDALDAVRSREADQLLGEAVTYWRRWLEKGKSAMPPIADERLARLFLRSLLLLKLLQDRRFGSLIAAPTLDPDYRYCWPRDAVYLAWALDVCGYREEARHFYRWCQRTQMADGLWYQNHYTDGRRHWAGIQVDQVATIIWGAWQHFLLHRDRQFLVEMWPTLRRAAECLLSRIHPETGLIFSEQDLWEETGGFLTYTNASGAAGLECAARAAHEVGRESDSVRLHAAAELLRRRIDKALLEDGVYVGERSAHRRFPMRKDYLLDISNVGLAVPFCVVPADREEMRRTVALLEAEMDYPVGGVGRYASDLFVGGNPWSLSAIWLALYYAEIGDMPSVERHLSWCLRHAMLHDFLPEQSDKHTGAPVGAAPLAWSHAWFVLLMKRLGETGALSAGRLRLDLDAVEPPPGDRARVAGNGRPTVTGVRRKRGPADREGEPEPAAARNRERPGPPVR